MPREEVLWQTACRVGFFPVSPFAGRHRPVRPFRLREDDSYAADCRIGKSRWRHGFGHRRRTNLYNFSGGPAAALVHCRTKYRRCRAKGRCGILAGAGGPRGCPAKAAGRAQRRHAQAGGDCTGTGLWGGSFFTGRTFQGARRCHPHENHRMYDAGDAGEAGCAGHA